MKEVPEVPEHAITALATQYRGAITMLANTTNRRVANARFYISLISGLIALLTFATRPGFDSSIQTWVVNIVGCMSLLMSLNWYLTAHSLGKLARIQRALLEEMETRLPYDFVTRQEERLSGTFKLMRAGLIENTVPFLLMIPALLILLVVNF